MFDLDNIRSKLNVDELYNSFLWLDKKQQYLVGTVLGVLLIVVLILPVNCVSSKLNERQEEYQGVVKTATELFSKLETYNQLKQGLGKSGDVSKRLGTDPVKKIVYQITDDIGIDRHKATLKTIPDVQKGIFTEQGKELTIKNIGFDQTVQLLDQLLHYKTVPVRINKLTIKADRRNKQQMSSVVMTVSILKPNSSFE